MPEHEPADPRPLRRFPWAQLAFCLVSLAMAAWLWMNFSYVWEVTPLDLHSPPAPFLEKSVANPYFGSYVHLRGTAAGWCVQEGNGGAFHWLAFVPGKIGGCRVRLAADVPMAEGDKIDVVGRVIRVYGGPSTTDLRIKIPLCVEPTASRFHLASVVGIIIGAIGCVILGLHLARWLRERTTAT